MLNNFGFLIALASPIRSNHACTRGSATAPVGVSLSVASAKVVLREPIDAVIRVHVNAPRVSLETSDGGDYDLDAYSTDTGKHVGTPLRTISRINIKLYQQGDDIVAKLDLSKLLLFPGPGHYIVRADRFVWHDTCYSSNAVAIDVVQSI